MTIAHLLVLELRLRGRGHVHQSCQLILLIRESNSFSSSIASQHGAKSLGTHEQVAIEVETRVCLSEAVRALVKELCLSS